MIDFERIGKIKISDEVMAMIIHTAVLKVEGVVSFAGSFADGLTDIIKKKNSARGIKLDIGEERASIEIHIITEFGHRIPDIANSIQTRIKSDIEKMTGLSVTAVNIHIEGISFPNQSKTASESLSATTADVSE